MNLADAVKTLHDKGVRVIGRLVCFNDPSYAQWAWSHGKRNQVIQTPDGGYYGSTYGGFTNFANPAVRRYQIDLAVAAAKLGVDDVLYDYVRRPDGPLSTMKFPGLKTSPERSIASFLAETRAALKPYKTFLGASVFGVAATRPTEVAQDIPMMAEHLDYVSAMVYPSHWAPGEYGVRDPNAQPYDIVLRSLQDFQKDVRGTGARVVPWLQDFSLGVDYGPAQVGAEIQATHDAGIDEFLLWDPLVTYTGAALSTDAEKAKFPTTAKATFTGTGKPDELGVVPVLMHHQLRLHGSAYDLTPSQFLGELTRLWRDGFYPVTAESFVTGRMDVPKGKSPVVMTFDDATNNQVGFLPDGSLDPNSALGIMENFAKAHPDFPAVATFYIPRNAFEGNGSTPGKTLRWLVEHGFELGNHTRDHIPFNTIDSTEVQRQLVLGDHVLSDRIPGYTRAHDGAPARRTPHPALAREARASGTASPTASTASSSTAPSRRLRRSRRSSLRGRSRASGRTRTGTAPATSPAGCGSTSSSGTRACATSPTATRRRSPSRRRRRASSPRSTARWRTLTSPKSLTPAAGHRPAPAAAPRARSPAPAA